MPRLTTEEQLMTEKELIYSWLKQGRISCEELVRQYANTIRAERDYARHEALSYTYPLYLMQEKAKLKPKEEWIRDKAIQMLYAFNNKSNGIMFDKQFKKYVEEKNLNTDLSTIQYLIYKDELNKS